MTEAVFHIVALGEGALGQAVECAMIYHSGAYVDDVSRRTRITVITDRVDRVHEFVQDCR